MKKAYAFTGTYPPEEFTNPPSTDWWVELLMWSLIAIAYLLVFLVGKGLLTAVKSRGGKRRHTCATFR